MLLKFSATTMDEYHGLQTHLNGACEAEVDDGEGVRLLIDFPHDFMQVLEVEPPGEEPISENPFIDEAYKKKFELSYYEAHDEETLKEIEEFDLEEPDRVDHDDETERAELLAAIEAEPVAPKPPTETPLERIKTERAKTDKKPRRKR